MDIPTIVFRATASSITWRVGDPYVTVIDDGAEPYRETDWWRAWRRGHRYRIPEETQRVLDLIHRAGRFYGPRDEHHTIHLMEHLLLCAQGEEDAHSVHRRRGGYGPFWYTVWCALRGLPLPTPPMGRGCCYPVASFGPAETCEGCSGEIVAAAEPVYPL